MFQCRDCEKCFDDSKTNECNQEYLQCLKCGSKQEIYKEGFELMFIDDEWLKKLYSHPIEIQMRVIEINYLKIQRIIEEMIKNDFK